MSALTALGLDAGDRVGVHLVSADLVRVPAVVLRAARSLADNYDGDMDLVMLAVPEGSASQVVRTIVQNMRRGGAS